MRNIGTRHQKVNIYLHNFGHIFMKVKITGLSCYCKKSFGTQPMKEYQIFNSDLRVKIIFAGMHNLVLVKRASIFHFSYQRQILYAMLFDKKILIINKSDFYDKQNFAWEGMKIAKKIIFPQPFDWCISITLFKVYMRICQKFCH